MDNDIPIPNDDLPLTSNTESILNDGPPLSHPESILNDSRISPVSNGNPNSRPFCNQPTSGQKWWASVLLGFIFALISSPAAYYVTSKITTSLGGIALADGPGPNFAGLLVHTLIFIVIVRIILW